MLGIHARTGEWFVADTVERTVIAGTAMDIVWARNLAQPGGNGRHAVAKNAKDFAALRVPAPADAHQAFSEAFTALNTPKNFGVLRSQDYRTLYADLRAALTVPDPVSTAQAWRRARHYWNVTCANSGDNRGGSIELQQLTDGLFAAFAAMARAVYGDAAGPVLDQAQAAFRPRQEGEPAPRIAFGLGADDVIIGRAPATPTLAQAFDAARLPPRFDAGDFVVTYQPGRPAPACINGGAARLRATHYGILLDLFNQRGTPVATADLGAKYFPAHASPRSTVLAAISAIRKSFVKAGVPKAGRLIETVPGGHVYAAPAAPAA